MYLYLPAAVEPDALDASLLKLTGRLDLALEVTLTAERKLARADVKAVIEQVSERGYYLQLPPGGIKPRLARGALVNQG